MLGRLSTNYPRIKRSKSLFDASGRLVQPYGVYSQSSPAPVGQTRLYHVEFWPIGNRFEAGHRIRLDLVGASAASKPNAPALNTIVVGGRRGSRRGARAWTDEGAARAGRGRRPERLRRRRSADRQRPGDVSPLRARGS